MTEIKGNYPMMEDFTDRIYQGYRYYSTPVMVCLNINTYTALSSTLIFLKKFKLFV